MQTNMRSESTLHASSGKHLTKGTRPWSSFHKAATADPWSSREVRAMIAKASSSEHRQISSSISSIVNAGCIMFLRVTMHD